MEGARTEFTDAEVARNENAADARRDLRCCSARLLADVAEATGTEANGSDTIKPGYVLRGKMRGENRRHSRAAWQELADAVSYNSDVMEWEWRLSKSIKTAAADGSDAADGSEWLIRDLLIQEIKHLRNKYTKLEGLVLNYLSASDKDSMAANEQS